MQFSNTKDYRRRTRSTIKHHRHQQNIRRSRLLLLLPTSFVTVISIVCSIITVRCCCAVVASTRITTSEFKFSFIARSTTISTKTATRMKAWTCHGRNQNEMVHRLHQAGIIRSAEVYRVMSLIDRKNYFPSHNNDATTPTTKMSTQEQTPLSTAPHRYTSTQSTTFYEDSPYPIGYGQTISAPHMHAFVLEEIISHLRSRRTANNYKRDRGSSTGSSTSSVMRMEQVKTGNNGSGKDINPETSSVNDDDDDDDDTPRIQFLDVGCGSGYITACFGRWLQQQQMVNEEDDLINTTSTTTATTNTTSTILGYHGYAYGIDIVPELVKLSTDNIMKEDSDLLLRTDAVLSNEPRQSIVTLQIGNGYNGLSQYAPFDVIHVGAAAISFPKTLCQQLKVGGLLIVPIHDSQDVTGFNPMDYAPPKSEAQTLYKIVRLLDKSHDTYGSTESNNTDASSSPSSPNGNGNNNHNNDKFDIKEYRITPLLGVRYVPLVRG